MKDKSGKENKVVVVIDTHWGDSGKGRIVNFLAQSALSVARFSGGSNAGHTIFSDQGRKTVLHLVPAGILQRGVKNYITNSVVIDPIELVKEIDELRAAGFEVTPNNLMVSGACHVVLNFHKELDARHEGVKGEKKIGSTLKGISPVNTAKYSRTGIRLCDLVNFNYNNLDVRIAGQFSYTFECDNELSKMALDREYQENLKCAINELKPFIGDTAAAIYTDLVHGTYHNEEVLKDEYTLVFEGTQGTMLDIDHGSYPYVTSSSCLSGAAATSAGIGPNVINEVVGTVKAYSTRVGAGPFPSQIGGQIEEDFRQFAGEKGATTGRPRRCGWLDMPVLKYSVRLNGITGLALTRVDTLGYFDKVKVCTHYRVDGSGGSAFGKLPMDHLRLDDAVPEFKEFDGWKGFDFSKVTRYDDLPANVTNYIEYIETSTGVPIKYVSYGPNTNQLIERP